MHSTTDMNPKSVVCQASVVVIVHVKACTFCCYMGVMAMCVEMS